MKDANRRMLIRDYYHTGCPLSEGSVGTPGPLLTAAWKRWQSVLLPWAPDRPAFLDMPAEGGRILVIAVPGMPAGFIGFALDGDMFARVPSVFCLYHAIERLDGAAVMESVFARQPIELGIEPCPMEPTPIPADFSELNGLQMIGTTERSLYTVTRMLPEKEREKWMPDFFLAVNPSAYSDDFTTIVSEDVPDGEWNKLRSEHTEFSSALTFHSRRRAFLRKRMRPRILLFLLIAFGFGAAAGVSAFFCGRAMIRMNRRIERLTVEKERLEFSLRNRDVRLLELQQRNLRLEQDLENVRPENAQRSK